MGCPRFDGVVGQAEISMTAMNKHHRNEVHLRVLLARDPEIRYTANGKPVANFTVATTYESAPNITDAPLGKTQPSA
jgi:hypothetical protein